MPGDREVPEGITANDLHDSTHADGGLGIGAVARIAEQARGRAPLRVGERQGTRHEAGDAEDSDVVDPIERDDVGVEELTVVAVDPRRGDPGNDVRVGDHETGPATQPEPSMPSPQAVPTTRTTLSAASLTPAESSTAGSGASTPAAGPASEVNGSICASVSMRRCGGTSWLSFERIVESWA